MTTVSYDTRDVLSCLKALQAVDVDLRKQANSQLREAAADVASLLVGELQQAAASAPTPQARLVASTAKVKSDRIPAVQVGGRSRVGHRRTAAGVLLWGSEHGGRHFPPGPGGPYWLEPTVRKVQEGPAADRYRAAVFAILKEHGLV